jgi:hypothetical protein
MRGFAAPVSARHFQFPVRRAEDRLDNGGDRFAERDKRLLSGRHSASIAPCSGSRKDSPGRFFAAIPLFRAAGICLCRRNLETLKCRVHACKKQTR